MRKVTLVVMSDSHGDSESVFAIMKKEKDADYFIHCGDLGDDPRRFPGLIAVRGNNDYSDAPISRVLSYFDYRIYVTHSHRMIFNFPYQLVDQAKANDCSMVLFGHTHCVYENTVEGITLLNPGAIAFPRDGSRLGYYVIEINEEKQVKYARKVL